MKIEFIRYPIVITDDGKEIEVEKIAGHPKVGSELSLSTDGTYKILAITSNSDCVSGVCPVR